MDNIFPFVSLNSMVFVSIRLLAKIEKLLVSQGFQKRPNSQSFMAGHWYRRCPTSKELSQDVVLYKNNKSLDSCKLMCKNLDGQLILAELKKSSNK